MKNFDVYNNRFELPSNFLNKRDEVLKQSNTNNFFWHARYYTLPLRSRAIMLKHVDNLMSDTGNLYRLSRVENKKYWLMHEADGANLDSLNSAITESYQNLHGAITFEEKKYYLNQLLESLHLKKMHIYWVNEYLSKVSSNFSPCYMKSYSDTNHPEFLSAIKFMEGNLLKSYKEEKKTKKELTQYLDEEEKKLKVNLLNCKNEEERKKLINAHENQKNIHIRYYNSFSILGGLDTESEYTKNSGIILYLNKKPIAITVSSKNNYINYVVTDPEYPGFFKWVMETTIQDLPVELDEGNGIMKTYSAEVIGIDLLENQKETLTDIYKSIGFINNTGDYNTYSELVLPLKESNQWHNNGTYYLRPIIPKELLTSEEIALHSHRLYLS